MIRTLNYVLFIVTFTWAGMDLLAWGRPAQAMAWGTACFCSGALARRLYLRAR